MDGTRFDRIARLLGAAATRRQGIAAALGAVAGVGALTAEGQPSMPKGGPWPAGPCGPTGKDNRCTKNKQCCTGYCKIGKKGKTGRCRCIKLGGGCKTGQLCCGTGTCVNGACAGSAPPVCDASTCAAGCCEGTTCKADGGNDACGAGGGVCAVCSSLLRLCCGGACTAGVWQPQTLVGGTSGSAADQFISPVKVWASADLLTMWVSDPPNTRISVWTRPTADSPSWSHQTNFGATIYGGGSAVADGLTVLVAFGPSNRIEQWIRTTPDGTDWTNSANFGSGGVNADQFLQPTAVFVAADGLTAWVVDSGNNRISVWNRADSATAWSHTVNFGVFGPGTALNELMQPSSAWASPDGLTVWVADMGHSRITVWTRSDAASTSWSAVAAFGTVGSAADSLGNIEALSVSTDGLTAFLVDYTNSRVSVWTRPDATSLIWTWQFNLGSSAGSANNQFSNPMGGFLGSDGVTLWVADNANSRVSIWEQVCQR
ncbi:MAG: NHL repeat-containing protein [Thermomicrobiales bacterium]